MICFLTDQLELKQKGETMDAINFPSADFKNVFLIYMMIVGFFGLLGILLLIRGSLWRDLLLISGGLALILFSLFMFVSN